MQPVSLIIRRPALCICKTKALISCVVTVQLISAFVFRYIYSTFTLLPKSKFSSLYQATHGAVQVVLVQRWSLKHIGLLSQYLRVLDDSGVDSIMASDMRLCTWSILDSDRGVNI